MNNENKMKIVYDDCDKEGFFIPLQNVDYGKIKSMLEIVEEDLDSIKLLKKFLRFNTIYKLSYDVLHTLTEAILLTDTFKSKNHKCLFAYLCEIHPELDLDWSFFEEIRRKRNGIHYYGSSVDESDWLKMDSIMSEYILILKNKLKSVLE